MRMVEYYIIIRMLHGILHDKKGSVSAALSANATLNIKPSLAAAAAERNDFKRSAAVVGDVHSAVPHARLAGAHKSTLAKELDLAVGKDALQCIATHVGNIEIAGCIDAHSIRSDRKTARMKDLLALHDASINSGRKLPNAAITIVAGVDESLGIYRNAVESTTDLEIARDIREHALRIGWRIADLHIAVSGGEHVKSARGGTIPALDVVEERLGEIELAVQILDAVRIVETIGDNLTLIELVILEGDAQKTPLGVLLVVADVEFAFRSKAYAHRRSIAALLARRNVEPLNRRSARLVETEHRTRLRTVVVRSCDHKAAL